MVKEVTSQPGCAREVVKNIKIRPDRHVYNSTIDVLEVKKAFKAPFPLWKQWLLDSNTCKPVVPGRTFADVVKQNAYSCNNSAKNSVPLEATQMCKPQGKLPEPVKEETVHCTSSPQVRATCVSKDTCNVNRDMCNVNLATNTIHNDISLYNRFAILQSEDAQENLVDSDLEYESIDRDIRSTFPYSGKASPGDQTTTCDIFDNILLKKKVDQDIIVQAKSCDDYMRCKSQMDRPFGVIPLSPLKIYTGPPTNNKKIPDPLLLHRLVRTSGCPNFMGLRIPVQSNLNIPVWKSHLEDYWD